MSHIYRSLQTSGQIQVRSIENTNIIQQEGGLVMNLVAEEEAAKSDPKA